jgi:hypothetical protein
VPLPRDRFSRYAENGITFVFKHDPDAPELLHIYARHMTDPDDALDVFFDPSASQTWNAERERFERFDGKHGLYWFWIEKPTVVMVVTCFPMEKHHG